MEPAEEGWRIEHDTASGLSSPDGHPQFYQCIRENGATYPPAMKDALEELWEAARQKQLGPGELQSRLDQFSDWLAHYDQTRDPSPSSMLD